MRKHTPAQPYSTQELKEFRANLSRLKKQGLIDKSVDARSARPYFIRGGKRLDEAVIKGLKKESAAPFPKTPSKSLTKSTPSELPPTAKQIAVQSASVKRRTPKPPTAIKLAEPKKPIAVRVLPGLKGKNVVEAMQILEANAEQYNKLKKPTEYFGFRIYGQDLLQPFDSIQAMLGRLDLLSYNNFEELYDNFQIIRWTDSAVAYKQQRVTKPPSEHKKAQNRYRTRKRRQAAKKGKK
jgi:hypothetical protein